MASRLRCALPDSVGVGDEKVVADHLDALADGGGEGGEALRVVLGERILDRQDRIALDPSQQHLAEPIRVELAPLEAEPVTAVAPEFRGRHIEGDRHLVARRVAGALDGAHEIVERFLVGGEGRPPAAFVGHAHAACRRPPSGRRRRDRPRRSAPALRRNHPRSGTSPGNPGRRPAGRHALRRRKSGSRAPGSTPRRRRPATPRAVCRRRLPRRLQMAIDTATIALAPSRLFAGRAVGRDHRLVERRLIGRSPSDQEIADFAIHVGDRAADIETAEPRSAVAQVERFARSGRGAGRRDCTAARAAVEDHLGLHRRAGARVPDATADHVAYRRAHQRTPRALFHLARIGISPSSGASIKGSAKVRTLSLSA